MKRILDVCCGGRAFWFNKKNPDVVFCDKRNEGNILLCNGQTITIKPDVVCDFKGLPFENETFYHVVFDPPHLVGKSAEAWMVKKYGSLPVDWKHEIKSGFDECMRVLKPNGTLIFKWNEVQIPVSQIIDCVGVIPLYGHTSGKRMGTHWLAFIKNEK